MYIPLTTNAKEALCELYGAISNLQNGMFIVAKDFNDTNLKTMHPKFHH